MKNIKTSKKSDINPWKLFQITNNLVCPISDVHLICGIIDWRICSDPNEGFIGFEILAISSSRCTIIFQYSIPSFLLNSKSLFPWLQIGSLLSLRFITIKEYDKKFDVLTIIRSEHTIVDFLGTNTDFGINDNMLGKIKSNWEGISKIMEKERMVTLRSGKEYIQNLDIKEQNILESCERRRYCNVNSIFSEGIDGRLLCSFNNQVYAVDPSVKFDFKVDDSTNQSNIQQQQQQQQGDYLVVNRRYFNETKELIKEELVVIWYEKVE